MNIGDGTPKIGNAQEPVDIGVYRFILTCTLGVATDLIVYTVFALPCMLMMDGSNEKLQRLDILVFLPTF